MKQQYVKPPIGVMPLYLWEEANPSPTRDALHKRYVAVSEAIQRYREAGLEPKPFWLCEVGLLDLLG